jgi:hypothetical protein
MFVSFGQAIEKRSDRALGFRQGAGNLRRTGPVLGSAENDVAALHKNFSFGESRYICNGEAWSASTARSDARVPASAAHNLMRLQVAFGYSSKHVPRSRSGSRAADSATVIQADASHLHAAFVTTAAEPDTVRRPTIAIVSQQIDGH